MQSWSLSMKTSTCISHWFLQEIDWHDLCTFNLTFNFNICTINRVIHVSRHAFKPPLIFFFFWCRAARWASSSITSNTVTQSACGSFTWSPAAVQLVVSLNPSSHQWETTTSPLPLMLSSLTAARSTCFWAQSYRRRGGDGCVRFWLLGDAPGIPIRLPAAWILIVGRDTD